MVERAEFAGFCCTIILKWKAITFNNLRNHVAVDSDKKPVIKRTDHLTI